MLKFYIGFTILSLINCSFAVAQDENVRYALVIGNKNYQKVPLPNPINDAKSIAKNLIDLNFKVTHFGNCKLLCYLD